MGYVANKGHDLCCKFQHKNAKVVQGSSLDVMGLVAILVVVKSHINDNNTSISLPARNLEKEINIKTIQRNYDGE